MKRSPGLSAKAPSTDRILDANLNRCKEGLRVCEEIIRFIVEDSVLTENFKKLRHSLDKAADKLHVSRTALMLKRNSREDIGRSAHAFELKRKGLESIFWANIQRAKESLRVLEEFSKLKSAKTALLFKGMRYEAYELEKKSAKRISSLLHR